MKHPTAIRLVPSIVAIGLLLVAGVALHFRSSNVAAQSGPSALPTPVVWVNPQNGDTCYLTIMGIACTSREITSPAVTSTPAVTPANTVVPTSTNTPTPVTLTLKNPGFEQGLADWIPFTTLGSSLEFNVERLSQGASQYVVREGDASLRVKGRWQCWIAGYYQVVSAPIGTRLKFSVHVMTWGRDADNVNLPRDPNLYSWVWAGIDPLGGTDAKNTRVNWSGKAGPDGFTDFPDPAVREFSEPVVVESVALTNRVTVFIRADLGARPDGGCVWPYASMLAFFDEAKLEVVP